MEGTVAKHRLLVAMVFVAFLIWLSPQMVTAQVDVRIKDMTDIAGWRSNDLLGYGLVVGLNGTGSKNPETRQLALSMLERLGARADPALRAAVRDDTKSKTDNLAVVMVTAELLPGKRNGQKIDVTVSALGDAESLQYGQLIRTPLTGVDGQVYAVASGPVSVIGFKHGGQSATVQKNHPTVGRIPGGATVEKEVCMPPIGGDGTAQLLLQQADFENAERMAEAINEYYPGLAYVIDPGTIEVLIPREHQTNPIGFVARLQSIQIQPDVKARVVINERTGTVVVGEHVKLSRVAITHANLAVITAESPEVSQPGPFGGQGQTTTVPRTDVEVVEGKKAMTVVNDVVTVGDLATALNTLGVTPRDLSAIFQMLREHGSLHAELVFK